MGKITVLSIDMIVSDPDIADGQPIIAGTNVRVADIYHRIIQMQQSIGDVRMVYPQLSPAQIHAALAYYHANQANFGISDETGESFEQPDSGSDFIGIFADDIGDLSISVRETLKRVFGKPDDSTS